MHGRAAEAGIQFESAHVVCPLDERLHGEAARALLAWREILARLGVLGWHPERYEGLDYGNVSARLPPFGAVAQGRRRFLVTGTRTAAVRLPSLDHFAVVERYDVRGNRVQSVGPVAPSSETLTHGAIYDVAPAARVVLHAHVPEIWRSAARLGIPATRESVAQGTPEMALEVQRLVRETAAGTLGILAMDGHEDGVLAFGPSAAAAGEALVRHLARALELA